MLAFQCTILDETSGSHDASIVWSWEKNHKHSERVDVTCELLGEAAIVERQQLRVVPAK